jgi:hypothetical protein
MSNINEQPLFEHDCDDCIFLGRWAGATINPYKPIVIADLYIHVGGVEGITVIARYSSVPSENSSGLTFGYRSMKANETERPLADALRRALRLGIVTMEQVEKQEKR